MLHAVGVFVHEEVEVGIDLVDQELELTTAKLHIFVDSTDVRLAGRGISRSMTEHVPVEPQCAEPRADRFVERFGMENLGGIVGRHKPGQHGAVDGSGRISDGHVENHGF